MGKGFICKRLMYIDTPTTRCKFINYWLMKTPIPIFGSALGLLGLSILAQLNPMLMAYPIVSKLSLALGLFILLLGIAIHTTRFIYHNETACGDMKNLMVFPFLGQVGIALLLLAEALRHNFYEIAKLLFELGLLNIIIIKCWWLLRLVESKLVWEVAAPSWFVPPIGCLYIAILSKQFGFGKIAFCGLMTGLLGGLLASLMIATRLYKDCKLPQTATPALTIIVALPALLLMWLTANNVNSSVTLYLYQLNTITYCVAAILFFQLMRRPFSISWWAFGMPLTALSISLIEFGNAHHIKFASVISNSTTLCSTLITLILTTKGFLAVWRTYRAQYI